jgi:SAM-dependent methyltransferase
MSSAHFRKRKTCRICGAKDLKLILNLGKTALANAFLSKEAARKKDATYPLQLVFCRKCSLVQLAHVVDPEVLFSGYHYLTSGSPVLVDHFQREARDIVKRFGLGRGDLAVEIGSNDGILLSAIKDEVNVLGVDPAETAALEAKKRGVETIVDFFGVRVAKDIVKKHGQAKVIFANNVIAHIDDLDDVFRGIEILLRDDGVFVFEAHWVYNLIGDGGFDQIYHEHLSYYSLHAVKYLAERFGFMVTDVQRVPIHGESLRFFVQKKGKPSARVKKLLALERSVGIDSMRAFRRFAPKVEKNKRDLKSLLDKLKKKGASIAGYGASAKGNTLLNYVGVTAKHLDFITDTIPLKQWTFTPGAHIPVVPPDILFTKRPDYLLLLAWNYAPAILHREQALRAQGTKFIIPVPKVKVM